MGNRVHRVSRAVRALAIVVACFGTAAAAAQAATLKVTVGPAQIHKSDDYKISVNGTYSASEVTGKAYLISMIQYSSAPCRATAQQENSHAPVQFYFRTNPHSQRVGIFVGRSPFSRTDRFTAASPSTRRVCAYLYPKLIGANDTTTPIATASAKYKVVKKK